LGKALPEGTVQRTGKGWEEVPVPPAPTTRLEPRLVQMSELPEHALQSAVVGVALDSNEKMLVGAPTGAGKTLSTTLVGAPTLITTLVDAPTGAGKTNLDLLAIEQYSVAVALSTTLSDAEEALTTASVQVSSVSLPALSRIVMDV
jgi:hypothetical protein